MERKHYGFVSLAIRIIKSSCFINKTRIKLIDLRLDTNVTCHDIILILYI